MFSLSDGIMMVPRQCGDMETVMLMVVVCVAVLLQNDFHMSNLRLCYCFVAPLNMWSHCGDAMMMIIAIIIQLVS